MRIKKKLPKYQSRGQFRGDIYGDDNLTAAAGNIDAAGYSVDSGLDYYESTGDICGAFGAAGYYGIECDNRGGGGGSGAPNASASNTTPYANQGFNSGRWDYWNAKKGGSKKF
jgi:hypothetical protein